MDNIENYQFPTWNLLTHRGIIECSDCGKEIIRCLVHYVKYVIDTNRVKPFFKFRYHGKSYSIQEALDAGIPESQIPKDIKNIIVVGAQVFKKYNGKLYEVIIHACPYCKSGTLLVFDHDLQMYANQNGDLYTHGEVLVERAIDNAREEETEEE